MENNSSREPSEPIIGVGSRAANHTFKVAGIFVRGIPSLNRTQNLIAFSAIGLIALSLLFPPWEAAAPNGMVGTAGYYFLLSSAPQTDWKFPSLDGGRLFVQLLVIGLVTGVAIYFTRSAGRTF